jgi:hypothetical protein
VTAGPDGRGRAFWAGAAVGWAVIGWAVWQIARHRVDTRPGQLGRFVFGAVLLHDLVVVPATLLCSAVLARLAPAAARRWLQAALVMAGVTALVAYPLVRGFAHVLGNPTSLPRNYTVAVIGVVGTAWCGLAVLAAVRAGAVHRRRRPTPVPTADGRAGQA